MADLATLSADALLRIPESEPERLFSAPDALDREFRLLAKRWHPDLAGSETVFKHLNALHAVAERRVKKGTWETPGLVEWTATTGKKYRLRYFAKRTFELGDMLIGPSVLAFVADKSLDKPFNNGRRTIGNFRFHNDKMRGEFAPRLPQIEAVIETKERLVMVIKKTPELILLSDLLKALGGKIEPKHVAWILSELHNLACYLEWAGLTHNGIGPDTVFISPPHHSACLYGGWWFAAPDKGDLTGRMLPARTVNNAPPDVIAKKRASKRTDLELIRATGRELFGNVAIVRDPAVPKPLADWLTLPTSGSARTDYKNWQTVLTESFGVRRFHDLSLAASDIYKEI